MPNPRSTSTIIPSLIIWRKPNAAYAKRTYDAKNICTSPPYHVLDKSLKKLNFFKVIFFRKFWKFSKLDGIFQKVHFTILPNECSRIYSLDNSIQNIVIFSKCLNTEVLKKTLKSLIFFFELFIRRQCEAELIAKHREIFNSEFRNLLNGNVFF